MDGVFVFDTRLGCAGNHALALAYHGKQLGIPVTVVMPTIAPITKVQNCRELGATVHLQGDHIGQAREIANGIAAAEVPWFVVALARGWGSGVMSVFLCACV